MPTAHAKRRYRDGKPRSIVRFEPKSPHTAAELPRCSSLPLKLSHNQASRPATRLPHAQSPELVTSSDIPSVGDCSAVPLFQGRKVGCRQYGCDSGNQAITLPSSQSPHMAIFRAAGPPAWMSDQYGVHAFTQALVVQRGLNRRERIVQRIQ